MRRKFENCRITWKGVLMLAALSAGILEANATTSLSALPDMTQLTQFAFLGNNLNLNLATINGPAGISPNGTAAISGPSTLNGNLYLGIGATKTGGGTVTGTTFTGANVYGTRDLVAAQAQVFTASATFSSYTPDTVINGNVSAQSFGSMNGVADVQVFTINGNLSLSGAGITFVGDAGDVFVLNVTGNISGTGSANIGTVAQAAMTIINLTSSGSLGTVNINNHINGTILVPNASSLTMHSGAGAIYAGLGQVTLMSGATLDFVPFVPEAGTWLAAALLLVPLGIGALRMRRISAT